MREKLRVRISCVARLYQIRLPLLPIMPLRAGAGQV